MMNLIKKEFRLAMHPTSLIFLLLSAMLMIPNYPYYIIFFYTGLAVFFTCLTGRENNDVFYTMTLPVAKKDIVKARFSFVIILEVLQVIIAIPFAFLRQNIGMPGNLVGMDANISLFGLSFIMMGLFNIIFFGIYYKNVKKVGKAFIVSSIITFLYMGVAEACDHVIPFFMNVLDTSDNQFLVEKLIVLSIGIAIFTMLTLIAYFKAVKNFNKQDV